MTLGNMRSLGVRSIIAHCSPCSHSASVNCDRFPDDFPAPDVDRYLRCFVCGSKKLTSIIDVGEMYSAEGGEGAVGDMPPSLLGLRALGGRASDAAEEPPKGRLAPNTDTTH